MSSRVAAMLILISSKTLVTLSGSTMMVDMVEVVDVIIVDSVHYLTSTIFFSLPPDDLAGEAGQQWFIKTLIEKKSQSTVF